MEREINKKIIAYIVQSIMIVVLIILILIMIINAHGLQGNAKVINYAGKVRGGTQRLVKLEIINQPNDQLIQYLDTIIYDLIHGGGESRLIQMKDDEFVSSITYQMEKWELLKSQIYELRQYGAKSTDIINLSEEYYQISNDTAQKAENYTEKIVIRLRNIELGLIINIILILLFLLYQGIRMTELRHKNKELDELANLDMNTNIPNKGNCDKFIRQHNILNNNHEHACIMFDLNNLKIVNDTYGHAAGDVLIFNFAKILKKTVPSHYFIGRYGGDEFIAILLNTHKDEVEKLLDRFSENIKGFGSDENGVEISYAIGYELYSRYPNCTLQTLLELADKNMYLDKYEQKRINSLAAIEG